MKERLHAIRDLLLLAFMSLFAACGGVAEPSIGLTGPASPWVPCADLKEGPHVICVWTTDECNCASPPNEDNECEDGLIAVRSETPAEQLGCIVEI